MRVQAYLQNAPAQLAGGTFIQGVHVQGAVHALAHGQQNIVPLRKGPAHARVEQPLRRWRWEKSQQNVHEIPIAGQAMLW